MIVTLRTRGGTLAKAKEGKDYKLLVSFEKKITETSLTCSLRAMYIGLENYSSKSLRTGREHVKKKKTVVCVQQR